MKKLGLILSCLMCYLAPKAQYPITQNLGSTNTLVSVPGFGALRASHINRTFTDTTAANVTAISFYPGAQIVTFSPTLKFWIRDEFATGWQEASGSSVNIYNSNGFLESERRLSGNAAAYGLTFDSLASFTLTTYGENYIQSRGGSSASLIDMLPNLVSLYSSNSIIASVLNVTPDSIIMRADAQPFPSLSNLGVYRLLAHSPTGGVAELPSTFGMFGIEDNVQSNGYRTFTQNSNIFSFPGYGVMRFGDSIAGSTARVQISSTTTNGNFLDVGKTKPYNGTGQVFDQGKVNFNIQDTLKVNTSLKTAGTFMRRAIIVDTSGNINFGDKYNVVSNFSFYLRDTIGWSPANADLLNATMSELEVRKATGYSGRSVVRSGTATLGYDAANAILGRVGLYGGSPGNNFRIRGFLSGVTGYIVGANNTADTVDNFTAHLATSGGALSPVITRGYNYLALLRIKVDSLWGIYSYPNTGWNFLGAPLMIGASNATVGREFTQTPDNSLIFEINSTTQSMRGPSMTGVQMNAISSPVAGSLVYNTDSLAYCWYNGTSWQKSASTSGASTSGWELLGNAGTTAGTNYIGTSDNNALDFRSNATQAMRLNTSQELLVGTTTDNGAFNLQVAGNAYIQNSISVPGAGTNSQQFGPSNTAAQTQSITVGANNSNNGLRSIVMGYGNTENAGGSFADNIIIGNSINLSTGARNVNINGQKWFNAGNDNTSINGTAGTPTGSNNVGIGVGANVAMNHTVMLGYAVSATGAVTGSIALGSQATLTANNQMVVGSSANPITDIYFGKGVTNATPTAYTINGVGGSGSNIAGANLNIASGKGTGNAAAGSILFQTSDAGSSGSTLQTNATRATIDGNGLLLAAGKNMRYQGSSSGTITMQTQAAAGTYNWNWPTAAGTAGQPLLSGGGAGSAQTYGTLGVGAGGLGITTTPANGQIPIGNGTNYVAASITGTANQVNVNDGAGSITLSLPQSIGLTSSPQFAKLNLATGANTAVGTATLSSGQVTVNTTSVTGSSIIFVSRNTSSGTLGASLIAPVGSITPGTSFVIFSVDASGSIVTTDASTVNYWILN